MLFFILEVILLVILGFQVIYLLFFASLSLIPYDAPKSSAQNHPTLVILIPSFKEDKIIVNTVKSALELENSLINYRVSVGCDHTQPKTVEALKTIGAEVTVFNLEKSTKAKNLIAQIQNYSNNWPDYFLILDADNILETTTLNNLRPYLNHTYDFYQMRRVSKSNANGLAALDGIAEEIGNSIFRKGHRLAGLNSDISGSGMCIKADVLEKLLASIDINSAIEDKQIAVVANEQKIRIEYLPNIWVYDEKVADGKSMTVQRSRWIAGQLNSLKTYAFTGLKGLLKGNFNLANLVFHYAIIPKVFMLALLFLSLTISFLFKGQFIVWLILLASYLLALLLAIPRRFYHVGNLKALLKIPAAVSYMILAGLKIKRGQSTDKFERTDKSL